MKWTKKAGQVRRRLMAGFFCISLLAADLATVFPALAQETAMAAEQTESSGESMSGEIMNPGMEVQEETVQEPEADSSAEEMEGDGSQTQNPDSGDAEDQVQEPDDGEGTENDEAPKGEWNNEDENTAPSDGAADDGEREQDTSEEEDTLTDDMIEVPETPGADETTEEETDDPEEAESVSDNSVSENTLEEQKEVRALAVPADAIASGSYGNITWVVDKDGKLTVEGTGDFASIGGGSTARPRGPWCTDFYTRGKIKTAEIKVTGMTDASYMFSDCYNLTKISFTGSDTGSVTDMSGMFQGCYKLETVDLGQNFHTGNVTDMSSMFSGCSGLKNADVSGFNTSSVTNMSAMFYGCTNWGDMNLSGWDTGKTTDMRHMFTNCDFQQIVLGGSFTTHSVTDMSYMFACNSDPESLYGCSVGQERQNLTGLDLAWLDLSSVTTLRGIFEGCNVRGLDFGRLDTSVTTTLGGLFSTCDLTGVDFSKLRTDTITDMNRMFANSKGDIDLRTLNTEHVTDMSYMFASADGGGIGGYRQPIYCLTSIDLSGLDTSNVTNMDSMFRGQSELTSIDLSGLDTSNVTNMDFMFGIMPKLTSIDLGGLDTSKVESTNSMFGRCSSLTQIDLSGVDFGNVTTMTGMFSVCSSLQEVKLGNLGTAELHMIDDIGESTYLPVADMFDSCTSLETLDMSNFNYEYLEDGWSQLAPLYNCEKLTMLYTPYNVKINIAITGGDDDKGDEEWYMADGTKLTDNCLPKNLPYSVLIQKGSKPAVSAARMEVSKKKTLYGCGETIGTDDLTVTYYGADGSVRKLVQSDGQTDGYTTNAASLSTTEPGMQELVVIYTKDGKTLTGKITLTVAHILTAANTTVTLPSESDYNYIYDGTPKTPGPLTVTYTRPAADGTETPVTLTEDTDYTVTYRNNVNAYEESGADGTGEASGESGGNAGTESGTGIAAVSSGSAAVPAVIIKGMGKYSGTATQSFAIHKADAPAAEMKNVTASQCTQAQSDRKIDLTGSFAANGKKTGYEIVSVEDTDSIFSNTPVTADIKDGILTYGTNAAQEGDAASIKIKVSFQNYKDAELTVKITMASKKTAVISGIVIQESSVYSGTPVAYSGEAVVKTEDGTDITEKVTLVYRYSGTMADGTAYPATAEEPVNAGNYVLTVSVQENDPDYVGSAAYPFTITQAEASVKAKDLTVLMQAQQGEGSASVPVEQYRKDFGYEAMGLLHGDTLHREPVYTVTEDEAGTKAVSAIDTSKAGVYYIHPSGADAGMNYQITYTPGILTVSEERVVYTVTFDGMGHCDSFTKGGIKAGALLELADSERTPAAKEQGYVFAGWYQDRTFAKGKEWDFDTDTVQSDLTLYACWLTAAAQNGDGLKLCVQEIPDLTYTGSALKPSVTVYDSDGTTLLKEGKDYTVKYVRNTDAVQTGEDGKPLEAGGTAKVTDPGKASEKITDVTGHFSKECPYVAITGKGNYTETIYRNFLILPANIAAEGDTADVTDNTPLAAGFALKYTDQFEEKADKTAKIVSSMKYKKAMKADKDYVLSVQDENGAEVALAQGKLPLHAGSYILTITGKGNYTGAVRRKLYVAQKQKLMKHASVTLGKKQKTHAYTGEDVLLTPGYYDAAAKKYYKVTQEGEISSTPENNADDMFLVKAGKNGKTGGEGLVWGKDYTIDYAGSNLAAGTATMTLTGTNGYVGTKSVTSKITGAAFSAKTINVKTYDVNQPDWTGWQASMPYTGKAVTQNKVMLTAKVTNNNPVAQELVYGEHYIITYKNNVKKGTAAMTFIAKPESGYSGSFTKTFKITAQELAGERLAVLSQNGAGQTGGETANTQGGTAAQAGNTAADAVYSKNGAKLSFRITNEAGAPLREGTDYTVKYKNNNAVTTAQTAGNKKPLLIVTGKGNYAGKVEVPFNIIPASIESAIDGQTVSVSCAQVQKKDGMKYKDFKLKLVEGKKALGVGETKDYIVDETNCTPEKIKAYADAVAAGTALPEEPSVTVKGRGCYTGERIIPLGQYIYADKLTAACLYVVPSEETGQNIYTGGQVTPDVAVYYGEKTAVSAAKKDKEKDETKLTAESGKYKLKKLTAGIDYTLSYGANLTAGKNKGSVTATGAGRYGGSVTVKFTIGKKAIY